MIAWFMGLKLAGKIGVGLGVLIALIAAIAGLVLAVNAHDRSVKQAGRDEITAQWNAEKAERQRLKAEFADELGKALGTRFDTLASQIGGINTEAAKISVELPRAMAAEPRYRDPNCGLTPPVLDQVNAARSLSRNKP